MTIVVTRDSVTGDIATEIARLEALLRDLEAIGSGVLPARETLERAPLLDPVRLTSRPVPCLVGGNCGHPTLSGPVITTSGLWIFAPELGWARTLSRFYRLGHGEWSSRFLEEG